MTWPFSEDWLRPRRHDPLEVAAVANRTEGGMRMPRVNEPTPEPDPKPDEPNPDPED